MIRLEDGSYVDGFVSKIQLYDGRVVGIKACVIEARPITYPKCGSTFELAFGKGKCNFCGTYYTTQFVVTEESAVKNDD